MMSSLRNWFRPHRGKIVKQAAGSKKTNRKLHVETLEDRIVPSTSVYFDDFAGTPAVDSQGNQYVLYSKLHGTVDLDPSPSRTTLVRGYDYTDFGYGSTSNPVRGYLVKYSPTQEVLWVKSTADAPGYLNGTKIGWDAGVEYLYAFGASITKMNLNGSIVWSTPTSPGSLSSVAIDTDGSVYGTGGGFLLAKWAEDGTYQWTRTISGAGSGVLALANGVVYAGGSYQNTSITVGGVTLTDDHIDSGSTSPDGFLVAYDTNGNFQSVAHFIDAQPKIASVVGSDVYLSAQFGYTTDMDPGTGQKLLTPGNVNGENLAVAKLTYNTGAWVLIWAERFVSSGSGDNMGGGLDVSGGDLYVSGEFGATTDFDPGTATYNLTAGGSEDIFAMKLSAATGSLGWVAQMGSTQRLAVGPSQENAGLAFVPAGAFAGIYLGGYVAQGTVNFNGVKIMSAGLDHDAFLARIGLDGSRQWSFQVGAIGRTMDDGDPGYAESGSGWKNSSFGWDGESRTHTKGTGINTASWTFTGLPNGTYQVATRYPTGNTPQKNASNATFRVNGSPAVLVDERTAPNDIVPEYLEGAWKNLGDFAVTNGILTVVLSDAADGTVIADVVRIWAVAPPHIGSFTASANPVPLGSSVTLAASNIMDGNPGATITQIAFYEDTNNDGVPDVFLGNGTQTTPGVWTFNFTFTTPGTHKLFAQALDTYGVLSDPLELDLQVN